MKKISILALLSVVLLLLVSCDSTSTVEGEGFNDSNTTNNSSYTITWRNYDGTILETDYNVSYGSTPWYNRAIPQRDSDSQYEYTFTGWSPKITTVTGNMTYTAQFSKNSLSYTIIWENYDGTVLETDYDVSYRSTPSYDGSMPQKDSDEQYEYTFTGWSPRVTTVTGNKTYTAQFSKSNIVYTIIWENYDGTILETDYDVAYGSTPSYDDSMPQKDSDEQYEYTFTGWSPRVTTVTGNKTYTAQFGKRNIGYTIIWENYDGTVLETDYDVTYGSIPSYDGSTPQRESDDRYDYTFAGWTPSVSVVTGNTTYTALYSHSLVSLFVFEDGVITGCTSAGQNKTELIVPESINGTAVEYISENAFKNHTKLTSIVIPSTIIGIDQGAFSGCRSLTTMVLPFLGTSATDGNFGGFFGTESYTGSTISYRGYYIPNKLTSLIINGGFIGDYAFADCRSIEKIVLSDSVTGIGKYSFRNCEQLKEITLGEGITKIDSWAFVNCISLIELVIGPNVTLIEPALYGCSALTSLTVPFVGNSGVKDFGKSYPLGYIFGTYSYPNSVAKTYSYYDGSVRTTTYYIPLSLRNVTILGGYISACALENYDMITNVTLGDRATEIDSNVLRGCKNVEVLSIGDYVSFYNRYHLGYFFNWSKDEYAYNNNYAPSSLKSVVFTGTNANTSCFGCTSLTSVTFTDNVTKIGSSVLEGCTSLMSINISDGVTSIEESAFSGCTSLTSITIPDSVTSIRRYAFRDCPLGIKYKGIRYVDRWCIEAESGITIATIKEGTRGIASIAFGGCASLTSVTIPDSVTSIGENAFSSCTSLTSITIPDSVTSIGENAFYNCTSLASITIPDSVTSIGDAAFWDCTSLTSITIPDGVTSIGVKTFCNCHSLTSITIPDDVTSIGVDAFRYCNGLTSITIPDSVTSIGEYAFSGCTGLTSITIPDSVTSIGEYAFSGCTGLTSITIPDGVTRIGNFAFYNCASLTTITYQGTKSQWYTVTKVNNWDSNTGSYKVYCADGTINK